MVKTCDFAIDIHTPTRGGRYVPIAILPHPSLGESHARAQAMAHAFGSGWIMRTDTGFYVADGILCVEATRAGVPAFTFETGEGGRLEEGVIDDGAVYIRNVMKWLKMIDGDPVAPEKTWVMKEFLGLRVRRGGLLLTRARLGDIVDEGAHLCSIVNIYGDEVETVTAPARGVFVRSTTLSTVSRGERAATREKSRLAARLESRLAPAKRARRSIQAFDLRDGVETAIGAQNPIDAVAAHDGCMGRVARRNAIHGTHDGPGDADLGHSERQHVVDNRVEAPECRVDGISRGRGPGETGRSVATPLQEGPGKVPGFVLGGDDPIVGNPVEDIESEERSADVVVDAEHDDLGAGLLRAVDDLGEQVSGAVIDVGRRGKVEDHDFVVADVRANQGDKLSRGRHREGAAKRHEPCLCCETVSRLVAESAVEKRRRDQAVEFQRLQLRGVHDVGGDHPEHDREDRIHEDGHGHDQQHDRGISRVHPGGTFSRNENAIIRQPTSMTIAESAASGSGAT